MYGIYIYTKKSSYLTEKNEYQTDDFYLNILGFNLGIQNPTERFKVYPEIGLNYYFKYYNQLLLSFILNFSY